MSISPQQEHALLVVESNSDARKLVKLLDEGWTVLHATGYGSGAGGRSYSVLPGGVQYVLRAPKV